MLVVLILENSNSHVHDRGHFGTLLRQSNLAIGEPIADLVHHHQTDILVVGASRQHARFFKDMRERSVTYIMQQYSRHGSCSLVIGDIHTFLTKRSDGLVHQMHSTQGMQETAVHGTRIDKKTQT